MQGVGASVAWNMGQKGSSNQNFPASEGEESMVEANIGGQSIIVDKRDESLIINNECKRIMRNLCNTQTGRGNFHSDGADVTQPSFLSPEDRVLFFKTKMFYLLQERHCFLQQSAPSKRVNDMGIRKVTVAETYPTFLSPFCESVIEVETPVIGARKRQSRSSQLMWATQEGARTSMFSVVYKPRNKVARNPQKTGMSKFLENIRKADQSALHMLDEKILKTMEGAGYAALLGNREVRKVDLILSLFPDYNLLLLDGKDEESKLNNLVSHVRTRLKVFDKLQSFYENAHDEDHTAHVFTVPNLDVAEVREELIGLKPKQLHQLDEKKMLKLYSIFKDDYGTAKTTLIADGTQPVVLSRKKLDRVRKYVDDCAEWRGNMLVPYIRETNFCFIMFPWSWGHDTQRKQENANSSQSLW